MEKNSRTISLVFLLFFYKVCISRYISIWHMHQQFLENVHQFIYLEGGVERRVWGFCFLCIFLMFKLFPRQSYLLPTLFSFHYTILPLENALQGTKSEITVICNLSCVGLEFHHSRVVLFWWQISIKSHLTAFFAIYVHHLPVFTQIHSLLFPSLLSVPEDWLYKPLFPRSSCPLASIRFGQREILEGGWKEEGARKSGYFSPSLCFEWHLQWAVSCTLRPASPSMPASTLLPQQLPSRSSIFSLWFSNLKGASCFPLLLIFWLSHLLC